MRRWLAALAPLIVLAGAVFVRIENPRVIQELRLKVFDSYQEARPRPFDAAQSPARIIDIDEESLKRFGQWPWPRPLLATLVGRLTEAGAALIVFDVVFAEPDRTSPSRVLQDWQSVADAQSFAQLRAAGANLPDYDKMFAEAIGQAAVILGFVGLEQKNDAQPDGKYGMAFLGDDPSQFVPRYRGAAANLPVLEEQALGQASFNSLPDFDNIVRRVPFFVAINDKLYPTLVPETLRVAQGAGTFRIKSSGASGEQAFGEKTGIVAVSIGDFETPTDKHGALWLYDTGPQPERYIPVWRVMSADFDASEIEGRVVFIGTSAEGLRDIRSSPLSVAVPGVELHVQALEQVFAGQYLNRPDWADGVEIFGMTLLGLIVYFGVRWKRVGAMATAVIGVAASGSALAASWTAFTDQGLLIDPIYPIFAGLAVYMVTSLQRYMQTESEKKQIRGAFSQYMSPAMVERLAENPDLLKLGGEMRDMTILFCDIRGFTAISEQFDAQSLTAFINKFLTPMTQVIMAREGTIDKYMGDCIMAFWNAPLDDERHADHGVESGLAMMTRLRELNVEIEAEAKAAGRKFIPINIGIGLNTGIVCVGNMGSDQRFDYSVLGDDVNLASRLEGQSKTYGVDIVIGENTLAQLHDKATLELDLIQVKGKTEPVRVHCVLGEGDLLTSPAFQALAKDHAAMLEAYFAQRWDDGLALVEKCRAGMNGLRLDTLYDLYEERLLEFKANPPGSDWDGVYIATSK
ncbi:MAG: adenylate/guanylate cyclase domain-containing protein [Alphaproteobacteria bacterium]